MKCSNGLTLRFKSLQRCVMLKPRVHGPTQSSQKAAHIVFSVFASTAMGTHQTTGDAPKIQEAVDMAISPDANPELENGCRVVAKWYHSTKMDSPRAP